MTKYNAEFKQAVLRVAEVEGLGSISKICRSFGIPTATYYRWQNEASQARCQEIIATETMPSKETHAYFITAERNKGTYPEATEYSGKWLIFVRTENVDVVWGKIKKATENGLLGDESKVSTARLNPNAVNINEKVICVYTYDFRDIGDVRRIRESLRQLGIISKIPYKADEDTLAGKYRKRGDRRISLYYE